MNLEGGKNDKPCKVCTGFKSWMKDQSRQEGNEPSGSDGRQGSKKDTRGKADQRGAEAKSTLNIERDSNGLSVDCPPDVNRLGRHTWTLLHSIGSHYPTENPSQKDQDSVINLLRSISIIYPCQTCALDFKNYLSHHPPQIQNRHKLERWLCDAHNHVNSRLGKEIFDCDLVSKRWRDGWDDGHCDP